MVYELEAMVTSTSTPGSMEIDVYRKCVNKIMRGNYNLLNDFRWAVQIDESLMNSHFKTIPGFRS